MKPLYNPDMGRKLTKPRPRQGEHLKGLREAAGLSQREVARLVGEPPQNITFWEQSEKPPRSDVLPKLAQVLRVRIEDILNLDAPPPRPAGPAGKLRKVFEELTGLPRKQQEKAVEFLALFIQQYHQSQKS